MPERRKLVKCWYVTSETIQETEGHPVSGRPRPYWIGHDEDGDFYCNLGENLFLAYEEARAELLRRLCAERDRIMGLIEALQPTAAPTAPPGGQEEG